MLSLKGLEDLLHSSDCTPLLVCEELAIIFNVRSSEVGLLYCETDFLYFLYPAELRQAGSIPLTSSAVAARTATTGEPEIFNRFVTVPHHNVFEKVKLPGESDDEPDAPKTIQKLMSAPVIGERGEVLGVVQICRKGLTPASAGPDFTQDDLDTLVRASRRVAILIPELLAGHQRSHGKLRFMGAVAPARRRFVR